MTCVLTGSSARMSLGGLGCRLQTCSRLASEWSDSTFRVFYNGQPSEVLSKELFFICAHMGSENKFSLIAQTETVGNFFKLYK